MSTGTSETVIQRFGSRIADGVEQWMPSPFLFAIILTYVVFVAGVVVEGASPVAMAQYWQDGFWVLLTFAMQMVLILVTGYAVADSDFVSGYLNKLASIPNDNTQAAALVAAISLIFGYFHWGIGLIVGAIFAIFVARAGHERGKTFHYPILCAAGYTSQTIWHVGPSTSAGLLSATEGHPFEDIIGIVPLTESVFTIYAFGIAVLVFLTVIPVLAFLAPTLISLIILSLFPIVYNVYISMTNRNWSGSATASPPRPARCSAPAPPRWC